MARGARYTCAMNWRTLRVILVIGIAVGAAMAVRGQQTAEAGALQYAELGTCKLANGQQIERCRLGYRTWGSLNADKSNAILWPSWFSGNSAAIGGNVGADRMVDP